MLSCLWVVCEVTFITALGANKGKLSGGKVVWWPRCSCLQPVQSAQERVRQSGFPVFPWLPSCSNSQVHCKPQILELTQTSLDYRLHNLLKELKLCYGWLPVYTLGTIHSSFTGYVWGLLLSCTNRALAVTDKDWWCSQESE